MKKTSMMAIVLVALLSACKNDTIPETSSTPSPTPTPTPVPTPTPGSLVESFGVSGVVTENPTTSQDQIRSSLIVGTSLYLAVFDIIGSGDYQWRIEKRGLATGALDPAFGTGGIVTENPSSGGDMPEDIASDGAYLYIAGYDSAAGGGQWRIEKRALSDGSLVTAFGGGDGIVVFNPSANWDEATCIAISGDYMYVAGSDGQISSSNAEWRIQKRRLDTGALDSNFSSGGSIVSNGCTGFEAVTGLWTDGATLFVAGWDEAGDGGRGRIEKYSTEYGEPDDGFGTSGRLSCDPSIYDDRIADIAVDDQAIYSLTTDKTPGSSDTQWLLEKRSLVNGSVVWGRTVNPSSGYDTPNELLLDGGHLYAVGIDSTDGDNRWRIEKRGTGDGGYASAFGAGGVVISNPSAYSDIASSIVSDAEAIYISGEEWNASSTDTSMRVEKRVK